MSKDDSVKAREPWFAASDVDELPARVAHAIHALMATGSIAYGNGPGPFTAAEVCVYDSQDALTPRHTAAALREAQKRGLAMYVPGGEGYWTPTNTALNLKTAFETRFLRDTDESENSHD